MTAPARFTQADIKRATAGADQGFPANALVWLAGLKLVTRFRQSRADLASGQYPQENTDEPG